MSSAQSAPQWQRVMFETGMKPDWEPRFRTAPTELVLLESMPEVCSEHGQPAVESRPFTVSSSGPGSEIPSVRSVLRSLSTARRFEAGRAQSYVRFECPACEDCLHGVRRYRRISRLLLLAIVLTFGAVFLARHFDAEQFYLPLAFAILPGCIPIGALLALVTSARSRYFADVWMTDSMSHLIVSAHPNFVTAVEQHRAERR